METVNLTSLIVLGLASWRYAYLFVGDSITEPFREKFLDSYERWAFKKRTRSEKKIDVLRSEQESYQQCLDYADRKKHSVEADRYEAIVQDIEEEIRAIKPRRSFHQNLWIKLAILFSCIYCMTFWSALVTYNFFVWFANFGAIWAVATLIGLAHDRYFTAQESNDNKVD